MSNPFEPDWLNFKLNKTQVCPPKHNIELNQTPPKCPNFEHVWPKIGRTLGQIWKNRTSNSSEPPCPNPGLSSKTELKMQPTHLKIPNSEPTK